MTLLFSVIFAAFFLVMGICTAVFVMMAFKAAHGKRHVFFCVCYITAVSSFGYYAMLSGQAWLITPNCRQLFYVRYLDWAATTPLIILAMGLVAGMDGVFITAVMGADGTHPCIFAMQQSPRYFSIFLSNPSSNATF